MEISTLIDWHSILCPLEEDELILTNNYLSPPGCKWQSSQGSSIRLALLTLHDSAWEPVHLANSQHSLDHFGQSATTEELYRVSTCWSSDGYKRNI